LTEPIHIISLGAGVQSSTLALMASCGEITPAPVAAIFADTQSEPGHVYTWLDELEGYLTFPLRRVTAGNLEEEILRERHNRKTGSPYYSTYIPAFVTSPKGKRGVLRRKCTYDFKLRPLEKDRRELIGKPALTAWRRKHKAALKALREAKKAKKPMPLWAWDECQSDPLAVAWVGISLDEISRVKPSREPWTVNRWPLIEKRMTRSDCVRWLESKGYRVPGKSACRYCPYHNDVMWQEMKENEPLEFAGAVQFERDFQAICRAGGAKQKPYLHDSLVPLSEIDFRVKQNGQRNLFNNECEGICGV
jgi:hypothetical protein